MAKTTDATRRLLVAEPDPEDDEQTARALSGLGYEVVARPPSGLEAIRATARHRPDLVVVNAALPGPLDGPGTVRAIDEIYGIPAVVTGAGNGAGSDRVAEPLPYVVLPKPFGLRDLKAAVESALRRSAPGAEWRKRVRDAGSTAGRDEPGDAGRPTPRRTRH